MLKLNKNYNMPKLPSTKNRINAINLPMAMEF